MTRVLCAAILLLLSVCSFAQPGQRYGVLKKFPIASNGWWDYIAVNEGKLYVSHGMQVNILDEKTGDSVGVILNTPGVHGIAFDTARGRGYTSNGRANNSTVFDLRTAAVIDTITTGQNPDAIMYEPFTKTIITCNGRSNDLSVIDAATEKTIATIAVGGKPEMAVSDGVGNLYVNIEDRSEIVAVNLKTFTVAHRWRLYPAEGPTGLAMDVKTKRLFAGCNGRLAVLDATTGKQIATLPIGDGCDGVAFDAQKNLIFTANGEGTITVIAERGPNLFEVLNTIPTQRGARTLTLDAKDGTLFLPTASFEKSTGAAGRPNLVPGSFQVLVVH